MRNLLIIYALLFLIAGNSYGQKTNKGNELEQYEQEFRQGERNIDFFNRYIDLLIKNNKNEHVSKLIDTYLMDIPLEKRYKGAYLNLLLTHVNSTNALSIKELIVNWDKLAEQDLKPKLESKIKGVYLNAIYCFTSKYSTEGIIDKDVSFGNTQKEILKIKELKDLAPFIKITKESQIGNTQGMLTVFKDFCVDYSNGLKHFSIIEKMTLNTFLSILLEKCDKEQCEAIIEILNSEVIKNNKMFFRRIDEFKGKLMFFEDDI